MNFSMKFVEYLQHNYLLENFKHINYWTLTNQICFGGAHFAKVAEN